MRYSTLLVTVLAVLAGTTTAQPQPSTNVPTCNRSALDCYYPGYLNCVCHCENTCKTNPLDPRCGGCMQFCKAKCPCPGAGERAMLTLDPAASETVLTDPLPGPYRLCARWGPCDRTKLGECYMGAYVPCIRSCDRKCRDPANPGCLGCYEKCPKTCACPGEEV
ncbi:hypothetical protein BCR44DRAFT_1497729 [Catenaria anguillulae PL171]|uniref:4Fe-4S ferredoxin-type domain-containing protein n=1 Tax=Catenaria anguillulae PL171 TaxID=765915 RepID=A0A1Y2HX08_9FUNG|nr:hypothetical protein BCR44DRAFT_1497729 [Catenaria anguillulae PL171]